MTATVQMRSGASPHGGDVIERWASAPPGMGAAPRGFQTKTISLEASTRGGEWTVAT